MTEFSVLTKNYQNLQLWRPSAVCIKALG